LSNPYLILGGVSGGNPRIGSCVPLTRVMLL